MSSDYETKSFADFKRDAIQQNKTAAQVTPTVTVTENNSVEL